MFCELAVIVMISGQPVQKPVEWIGGARTKADGGLTQAHCDEYITQYNMTHKNQLVCVCDK